MRRGIASARFALLALTAACGRAAPVHAARAPSVPDEVRLEQGSATLAYVSIDTVRIRQFHPVAVVPGEIVMDEDHTVRIFSPVTGRIRSVDAEPGDPVAAGGALAHIVSGDLAQARSDVLKADAQRTQAVAADKRAHDLFDHAVIARRELEQAENDAAQARAESDRAHLRLRQLAGDGAAGDGDFVLRAPISGTVVDRSANPGAEVRPDAAAPLFVLSALDTVWLTVQVSQRDLARVRRGSPLVFVSEALPGLRITATVAYVGSALDPLTRTATVRAVLPNPGGRFRVHLTGEARLLAPDPAGRPIVPVQSLVTRGAESIVFVEIAPGRFAVRPVVVSEDDGDFATVVAGLRVGDRVVTRGSILLGAELERAR